MSSVPSGPESSAAASWASRCWCWRSAARASAGGCCADACRQRRLASACRVCSSGSRPWSGMGPHGAGERPPGRWRRHGDRRCAVPPPPTPAGSTRPVASAPAAPAPARPAPAGLDPPPAPAGRPTAAPPAGRPAGADPPSTPHPPPADPAPGAGGHGARSAHRCSPAAGGGWNRGPPAGSRPGPGGADDSPGRSPPAAGSPPCRWGPPAAGAGRHARAAGPPAAAPRCWFCRCRGRR